MRICVLLLGLSSLCLASSAAAERFYAELDVGPSFVADSDIDGPGPSFDLTYDPGFHLGGAAGFRFFDDFRAEVNLNYREADADEFENGGSVDVSGDVGVFAAMTNAYYDADFGVPVRPYVGAGIGVGVVLFDVAGIEDESTEFAWNVMAGLSYSITEHWVATGGYRYFSTTEARISDGVSADVEFGTHELVLGARYEF